MGPARRDFIFHFRLLFIFSFQTTNYSQLLVKMKLLKMKRSRFWTEHVGTSVLRFYFLCHMCIVEYVTRITKVW